VSHVPRDVVFSTDTEDLPTGQPYVLYLPDDYVSRDVTQLRLDRGRVTELVTRDPREPDAEPQRVGVTLTGAGLGLAGRDVRGQRGLGVHWTRGGGLVQLGPTATFEDGTEAHVPGFWLSLDWSQCNRLIKFVRNARDQAFGRPE
jgi:hypothetical protein